VNRSVFNKFLKNTTIFLRTDGKSFVTLLLVENKKKTKMATYNWFTTYSRSTIEWEKKKQRKKRLLNIYNKRVKDQTSRKSLRALLGCARGKK